MENQSLSISLLCDRDIYFGILGIKKKVSQVIVANRERLRDVRRFSLFLLFEHEDCR